ncbi:hypothetical protein [uncultured Microbacterium sp.]|uniref:hypothetical protein n=1 Tax=uncultured Microbacterium sp. TaxID=191216 RepID=UPI0035C9749D
MRSSVPMPGNPWPHDMQIEVDDSPHTLIELLWVREAWDLRPVGDDLPPLLDAPAAKDARRHVDTHGWAEDWPTIWRDAVAHAGTLRDPTLFAALQASANGSQQRRELLTKMVGPSARDRFIDAFDDSWSEWSTAQSATRRAERTLPLEEHPERRSLDALIPAWERGLLKIVTIPVRGPHTRRIGPHVLLTTHAIRADPVAYAQALASFTS